MTYTPPSLDEIKDSFTFFDSWEERYQFIIDLGRELPELQSDEKIDSNLIRGCQSQVWMIHSYNEETGDLQLDLDSDAHIVKGLICIVLSAYSQKTPEEVLNFDIEDLFSDLDLLRHLSSTRGNGLRSMVARVQSIAEKIVAGG